MADKKLEWLGEILGEAYTEKIDEKVRNEIGKRFVAKDDYNTKVSELNAANEQLNERDTQLEALRKSTGDAAALQEQITALQTQTAEAKQEYEAELARVRLDSAVEAALTAAGAKNNTAVKALLADFLKDAKADDSGAVKGLAAEIETLSKAEATAFLFNTADENGRQQFKGMQPGEAGGKTPPPQGTDFSKMSYSELSEYMKNNPETRIE